MTIRVRRLEKADLPTRVIWFNTEVIYRNMTVDAPMSLAATEQWFADASKNPRRRDFTFLSRQDTELPVAMGGLLDIDLHHRRAELYMMVDPDGHGRGVGRRVVRWICNYGFIALNLNRIWLTTVEHNERAKRLYESHGFVKEATFRKHLFHCGEFVDRDVYGLLREEWAEHDWSLGTRVIDLEIGPE